MEGGSFGRLFPEFASWRSTPEHFRRIEDRPSRATHETSIPSSVREEFAHAAPENF
jgi:hypothetical protein